MASETVIGKSAPVSDMAAQAAAGQYNVWATALAERGFVVTDNALPEDLFAALQQRVMEPNFRPAQIGRARPQIAKATRSDEIAWVSAANPVDAAWLTWLDRLQAGLNRRLYLGLRSVESHYAHYAPGDYYRRHRDAFAQSAGSTAVSNVAGSNRVVSLVLYLHKCWPAEAHGELVLYADDDGRRELMSLLPVPNRLVLFMSSQIPHEVLPATQDRYSLAAWFRA